MGVIVGVIILGPLNVVNADPPPAAASAGYSTAQSAAAKLQCIETTAGLPTGINIDACVASFLYYAVVLPASAILWFAGQILDITVAIALNGTILKADFITTGWGICRDVANLFFIFILLYIAIATILQLSSYGMKNLLAKLIIIALLVNFSLVITKVIIDASNILALEFYGKLKNSSGNIDLPILGKVEVKGISGIFMSSFSPEKLLGTKMFDIWADEKGAGQSTIALIVLFLSAAILILIATFILFAGAVLFVIRIALLALLMILAPLAFLFMVLPKTQQYASQWWDKLFNQAFFAPAFLFLFYLVANMISSDFLKQIGESIGQITQGQSGMTGFLAAIEAVILPFIVIAIFMIACLIVAQKLGAVGASTVLGWGKDLKKAGQGYAGRVSKRYAGRTMAAVEKGLEGEGRVAGALRKVPFLQRGLAAGAQLKKKEVGAYEKQYTGYDTGTLEQLKGKFGTTREARKAMQNIIDKRNKKKEEDEILKSGSSIEKVKVLAKRERERAEGLEEELAAQKTLYDAQGRQIRKPGEEKEKPKLYDASGRLIT